MPFTSTQQAKLDTAQARNDAAKKGWQAATEFWNIHFVGITCYKDTKYDVVAAATWFTPNDSACSEGTDCTHQNKVTCKSEIALVRNNMGMIKAAYVEFGAAQANYDKVFGEVTDEAAADPQLQLEQASIQANAGANKLKWIFWISVVVVIAIAAFVYFKWIRKKI